MENNIDETKKVSLVKHRNPQESIYNPYFDLAVRLCEYLKIARTEGYLECCKGKLAENEPSRIIRHLFLEEYALLDLMNLILDKNYETNEKNLETFLEEQKIRNPKLREILRKALPIFARGENISTMKQALEPIVGKGLPDDEDIKYNLHYIQGPATPNLIDFSE